MKFPRYDYDDMVASQFRLLTEHLKVDHLRLLLGTSQGCMHSYLWSIQHPAFMDATFAMACQPVEIAGLNRMRRKMMDMAIRNDPAWMNGDYKEQPKVGLANALLLSALVGLVVSHVRDVYFLMITLAIGMVLWGVSNRWIPMTGGDNGLSGIPRLEAHAGLPVAGPMEIGRAHV